MCTWRGGRGICPGLLGRGGGGGAFKLKPRPLGRHGNASPPPPPTPSFYISAGAGSRSSRRRPCLRLLGAPAFCSDLTRLLQPRCSRCRAGVPLSALRCAPLGASPLPFPSPSLRSPPFPSTCFLRKRARSWCLLRSWGHGGSGPRWRRLRGGTPTPVLQKGGAEAEGGPRGEEPQVHRSFLQAANLLQSLYRLHLVREARWGRGLEKEGTGGRHVTLAPKRLSGEGLQPPLLA